MVTKSYKLSRNLFTEQEDVAGVFGVSRQLVGFLVKVWENLYEETKDVILPSALMGSKDAQMVSEEKLTVSIGLQHALLLSKLHHKAMSLRFDYGLTVQQIMRHLNLKRPTLYRYLSHNSRTSMSHNSNGVTHLEGDCYE